METQKIVTLSPRNTGVAIILTVILGPLGLFYASVKGGIILCLLSLILGIPTLGLALFLTYPASIIWAILATRDYNKKILSAA